MTVASAATLARLLGSALAIGALALLTVVSRADGAEQSRGAYLAPAGVCAAAGDARATAAVQARAVTCLVNWARAQEQRRRLASRPALERASALKGRRVASCRELSHTPCGLAVTAAVEAAGYRYGAFGENLFAGAWGTVTPREVVAGWLRSAPHRANLLRSDFRHVGVASARARGLLGAGDAVVWTITFASPR